MLRLCQLCSCLGSLEHCHKSLYISPPGSTNLVHAISFWMGVRGELQEPVQPATGSYLEVYSNLAACCRAALLHNGLHCMQSAQHNLP